jgi:hypothetical protein
LKNIASTKLRKKHLRSVKLPTGVGSKCRAHEKIFFYWTSLEKCESGVGDVSESVGVGRVSDTAVERGVGAS